MSPELLAAIEKPRLNWRKLRPHGCLTLQPEPNKLTRAALAARFRFAAAEQEHKLNQLLFQCICSHNVHMQWPNDIPPDLRHRLECVLGHRSFGPADIWGEVRDWLVLHKVEPVALPEDKRPDSPKF